MKTQLQQNPRKETAMVSRMNHKRSAGFTLVSTAVTTVVGGLVLAGAWLGLSDMMVQWKISHAERVMDQYAASAMQDLTNVLSWSWGAKMVSGPPNVRWKFYVDDIVEWDGQMQRSYLDQTYHIPPDRLLDLTYAPTRGIMLGGITPPWVAERFHNFYVWVGRGRAPRGVQYTMDRRDRMTVEGVTLEFNTFPYLTEMGGIQNENLKRRGLVGVKLTMHYTYNAPNWFGVGTRFYGSRYVRERVYETQISMRNWDTENNTFRDQLLGLRG